MEQDAWPYSVNTTKTAESIAKARVLCVGAGGIGCELLKTLVMTGFRDIEVRMIIPMPSLDRDRFNLCNCPHSAAPFKVQSFWRAAGGRPRHDRDEQPKPPVPVSQAPCRQLQGPGWVGGGGALLDRLARSPNLVSLPRQVAAEAVMRFCPEAKVVAHHGNIKEDRFGVEFFQWVS